MTTFKKFAAGSWILVLTLALSACSKSAQDNQALLIGNWQVQDEKSTIEFKADGTIEGTDAGAPEKGTYKFSDATHLQMVIDLTEGGSNAVPGMPVAMTLNGTLTVQDHDNVSLSMSMSLPGEANSDKAETVHLKRIK